jgi:DNA (cytosine-5)-methyltransferase 1
MEEVTGIRSSRLKHIPIAERGKRKLLPEEEKGSAFREILRMLDSTGYKYVCETLNACDYGAPQIRERVIFIGLREGTPTMPPPTHSAIPNGSHRSWKTFWEATADLSSDNAKSTQYSEKTSSYMKLIPPGGHWRQLPNELIPIALGGAYNSGGGKMGFFRKLSWDEPSPTLVTSPTQKGSIVGHPDMNRPLSVEEYKRLQGFPDDWHLPGGIHQQYKLIGNAVSVHFSFALAQHLVKLLGW